MGIVPTVGTTHIIGSFLGFLAPLGLFEVGVEGLVAHPVFMTNVFLL